MDELIITSLYKLFFWGFLFMFVVARLAIASWWWTINFIAGYKVKNRSQL